MPPAADKTITVAELLQRVRARPAPPAPLAEHLALLRRQPRTVPWRELEKLDNPADFVTAAYRACLGRDPHPHELRELAGPRSRAGRVIFLDDLRRSPEGRQLATTAPGLRTRAFCNRLFGK